MKKLKTKEAKILKQLFKKNMWKPNLSKIAKETKTPINTVYYLIDKLRKTNKFPEINDYISKQKIKEAIMKLQQPEQNLMLLELGLEAKK